MLAGLLSLLSLGSDFEGCSGSPRIPDGRGLPMGTGGCLVDADCGTDACSVLACVAGECVEAGPRTDADGDGFAPAPCGTDCNDANASVFPGALEQCDAIDQDCDGVVDEGAPGVRAVHLPDGLDDAQIVAAGDAFAVLGRGPSGEVAGYLLDRNGARGLPIPLFVPEAPGALERLASASDGERIAVAFGLAGGPVQLLEIEREGDALRSLGAPRTIGASPATAIDAHIFGGQTWVAFDTNDAEEPQRWLWRAGADLLPLEASFEVGPALADDGASVVVTSGYSAFAFVSTDGALRARHELPWTLATGLPIAAGEGAVFAAYHDAFDHNLITVTEAGFGMSFTAPYGSRDDTLSLRTLPEGVLVLRASEGELLRGWLLTPDFRSYVATFTDGELTPYGAPTRVSTATDATATSAILSAHPGVNVAAFLMCDTAP